MEKILYILIPIIYFLYQTYTNFQKESSNVKKRKLQKPLDSSDNFEPLKEQELIENIPGKIKDITNVTSHSLTTVSDYYNPEEISDEVESNRRTHSNHHHLSANTNSQNTENDTVDFDLRKAIIYQAILERPKY